MRVLVACKNGNVAPRDKGRHCLCAACKTEAVERRREWRRNNPDRTAQHSKDWISRNQDRRREIERAWKAANPDKVASHNKKAGAKWSRTNNGKRNALTRKRVAAQLQRTPAWADLSAIQTIYVRAAELSRTTGIPHEVDHIAPLQGRNVSGLHVHTNLQILSRTQNRAKQNSWGGT